MKTQLILIFIFLALCGKVYASETTAPERFHKALEDAFKNEKSLGSIVIENRQDGEIYLLSLTGEKNVIGHVVIPAAKLSDKPFSATAWAPPGVCAVAVNAIHIKKNLGDGSDEKSYGLISLLPREMIEIDPKKWLSYYNTSSSIYTDIPAGEKIFGGLFTPFLGARVEYEGGEIPSVLKIDVGMAEQLPLWVTFENRFGGKITIKYHGKKEEQIGLVYRPVLGVGRFIGSFYCEVGRIRAVHTGVICISTSPMGLIGGFQIIPHFHADMAPNNNTALYTQVMVIGPTDPTQQDYGRLTELFKVLQPRYLKLDLDSVNNGSFSFNSRSHVLAKFFGDTEWQNFPPLVGRIDDGLKSLVAIRIYLPSTETYK